MRLRALISRRSPFLLPLPDDRISLCVYADETGFRYWNRSSDPMPIKTINMAGLQKWEETDDYIIYLDKDAVMTTVVNYVTGTYDLFKERKADIDGAMELLRDNDIEWTSEDDSKLLLDINKAQLERIANTPATMEEEEFAPQTFTTRAVPTTYECCFRVGNDGVYVGEGYENLNTIGWQTGNFSVKKISDGSYVYTNVLDIGVTGLIRLGNYSRYKLEKNTIYSYAYNIKKGYEFIKSLENAYTCSTLINKSINKERAEITVQTNDTPNVEWSMVTWFNYSGNILNTMPLGEEFITENEILTQTSTPKPFVKSIMPSGKLAFVTGVNETTHTFLVKGDGVVTFRTGEFNIVGEKIEQLLVYKGLLTQAEKDTELSKNIRLK